MTLCPSTSASSIPSLVIFVPLCTPGPSGSSSELTEALRRRRGGTREIGMVSRFGEGANRDEYTDRGGDLEAASESPRGGEREDARVSSDVGKLLGVGWSGERRRSKSVHESCRPCCVDAPAKSPKSSSSSPSLPGENVKPPKEASTSRREPWSTFFRNSAFQSATVRFFLGGTAGGGGLCFFP